MRKLKFRAWDGLRISTNYIGFNSSTGEIIVPNQLSFAEGELPEEKRIKIMQFTGLADLWQKDIVRITNSNGYAELAIIEYDETEAAFGFHYFQHPSPYTQSISFFFERGGNISQVEKIGNVYEHPQLMSKNLAQDNNLK